MRGLVNPRIKDPDYLLGAERGDTFYRQEWLKMTNDHDAPDISLLLKKDGFLEFSGLLGRMKNLPLPGRMQPHIRRAKPDLSDLDRATYYESRSGYAELAFNMVWA
jgi:hypothetical protein